MKLHLPDHNLSLTPYVPGKPVEELERELGISGIVKLASNENPLGPSPGAIKAATQALGGVNRYPDGGAYYLRKAIAEKMGVHADRVVTGNGSTELVELIARAFLSPRDVAVISEGAFVMYRIAVIAANGSPRMVPLTSDLRHDALALARAAGRDCRVLFIANPNNPTGTYITRDELTEVLRQVPSDTLVVVDEAYCEYVADDDYPDSALFLEQHPNLIVLRTFSKIHGLAGLRIGYALVSPEVGAALDRVRSPFNTSLVAQAAAVGALFDDEHIEHSRRCNLVERGFLSAGLARAGLTVVPSVTNFLLVPLGKDAEPLYRRLLSQGVIVRPMRGFGFPEAVRISVGTNAENQRLLAALDTALVEP